MLSIERQILIKDILLEKKSVSVAELAERFDVSFETIRRDLKALEKEGVIEKSYGGAVLKDRVNHNVDFQTLAHILVDVKKKMAQKALQFVKPGDCIFIDCSTTCGQVAAQLKDMPVNVLTNSLHVMNQLSDKKHVKLFVTGGCWEPADYAFMGPTTLDTLNQFHVDKAFISCRSLSMECGISDRSEDEAELRRKIIESSNEVYLLADSTKWNRTAFVKTCDLQKVTAIIAETELSEKWSDYLDEIGVKYYNCNAPEEETEED